MAEPHAQLALIVGILVLVRVEALVDKCASKILPFNIWIIIV